MAKKKMNDVNVAFEEAVQAPSKQNLSDLGKLVSRAVELMGQIDSLTEATKNLNIELYDLKANKIPAMMDSAGVPSFETSDGAEIELADVINGSIPKDEVKRERMFNWLRKNGGGGIVKTLLSVHYGKGQEADAKKTRDLLKKAGIPFTDKDDVHFQTLCAFVRERIAKGKKVDYNTLGLKSDRVAKIKLPVKPDHAIHKHDRLEDDIG